MQHNNNDRKTGGLLTATRCKQTQMQVVVRYPQSGIFNKLQS